MQYILESTNLFENPREVSLFDYDQHANFSSYIGLSALSTVGSESFGIDLWENRYQASVPYLQSLVHFCINQKEQPNLELAEAFAQTDDAQLAIEATLHKFSTLRNGNVAKPPTGKLTRSQICSLFAISKNILTKQAEIRSVEFEATERGRSRITIPARELDRLFNWHYPSNYSHAD